MIEVEEMVEKRSIITFERNDKTNGAAVRCISDDDKFYGKVFLVPILGLIRKCNRIFVKKSDICAMIDDTVVSKREKMTKRMLGNTLNYMGSSAPGVEYIDSKAKSYRRS
jgi:hypothetical protein